MSEQHHTEAYFQKLKEQNQHFRRMPQMLPWVGKDFDKGPHKKLLFIGESHYVPSSDQNDEVRRLIRDWYSVSKEELQKAEKGEEIIDSTNPVRLLNKGANGEFNSKAHLIYQRIQEAVEIAWGLKRPDPEQVFRSFAYYNYFQRPAMEAGESIEMSDEDRRVAAKTFEDVVGLIQPDAVCVVSKMAIKELRKGKAPLVRKDQEGLKRISAEGLPKVRIEGFPHPSTSWWNREAYWLGHGPKDLTGKEKMIEFLKEVEASE